GVASSLSNRVSSGLDFDIDQLPERLSLFSQDRGPDGRVVWLDRWERPLHVGEVDQHVGDDVFLLDVFEHRAEIRAAATRRATQRIDLEAQLLQIGRLFETIDPLHLGVAPDDDKLSGIKIAQDASHLAEEPCLRLDVDAGAAGVIANDDDAGAAMTALGEIHRRLAAAQPAVVVAPIKLRLASLAGHGRTEMLLPWHLRVDDLVDELSDRRWQRARVKTLGQLRRSDDGLLTLALVVRDILWLRLKVDIEAAAIAAAVA